MSRLASLIFRYRMFLLVVTAIVTSFFAYETAQLRLVTVFDNLWPQRHPYMKLYNQILDTFGGANIITIVVEAKEGDIFNVDMLTKIKRISDKLLLVKDVNQYQVNSIARSKIKDVQSSPAGMAFKAVMWPKIPETKQQIEELKKKVYSSELIRGVLVSENGKAALISAGLLERELDYSVIFDQVNRIIDDERNDKINIYTGGEPMLYGWIYHYKPEMITIFLVTLTLIIGVLYLYTASIVRTVVPFASALLSAVWGLGFFSMMGYNLDPLILVIPFLISARVLSHSVQMEERFGEEYAATGSKEIAARNSFVSLFAPGILSIITDAAGIFVVFFTPIPLLQKLSLAGCFWVLSIIVTVIFLNPVIYSLLPYADVNRDTAQSRILVRVLRWSGQQCLTKNGRLSILTVSVVMLIIGLYYSNKLKVGDANPGSPILWEHSIYNQDVKLINELFPGLDQMYVVIEGSQPDDMKKPAVLGMISEFQDWMERLPQIGATTSIADVIPRINMITRDDYPKWKIVPSDQFGTGFLVHMLFSHSDPGDMDKFIRHDNRDANVTIYFKDHKGDTIREAILAAEDFFKAHPMEGIKIRLAGGLIGAIAAANEEIGRSQLVSIVLAFLVVFVTCAVTYRSILAGILFVIPLAISNFITFSYMGFKGIGLNVNTLPVAALGIGLGVDYGIYVVSRIREEFRANPDLDEAIMGGVCTSGKAVLFTASTIIISVITWYFLSDLRFQAEMGFLLALWTFISMLGGVFLLPAFIAVLKPAFVCRIDGR